jgi:hypothetical protein
MYEHIAQREEEYVLVCREIERLEAQLRTAKLRLKLPTKVGREAFRLSAVRTHDPLGLHCIHGLAGKRGGVIGPVV